MTPASYNDWNNYLRQAGPRMTSAQMEASNSLVTVLLCGEQSAIRIFSNEVRRGRAPVEALNLLRAIEYDEQLHERALSALKEFLPEHAKTHEHKRRAQRFFAGLGRVTDVARHFGQISHLDSAVCKIMWHIERSSVDKASPLRRIATQIKNDEARHVLVSRRYAASLGLNSRQREEDGIATTDGLIDMLASLAESFEVVGVDSDKLFAHIRKTQLP